MATIHQDFETPAKMALSIARNASPESTGKEIVSNSPIIYIEEIYIVSEINRNMNRRISNFTFLTFIFHSLSLFLKSSSKLSFFKNAAAKISRFGQTKECTKGNENTKFSIREI